MVDEGVTVGVELAEGVIEIVPLKLVVVEAVLAGVPEGVAGGVEEGMLEGVGLMEGRIWYPLR
jgi:hypothetical protein